MKGRSVGLALLVILTLASPAFAADEPRPDDVRDEAEPVFDKARDKVRDTWSENMDDDAPDDGAVEEAWNGFWDAVPENVRDPRDEIPEEGDETPSEDDPERLPVPGYGPTGGIGQVLGFLQGAAEEAEEAPAESAAFLQNILRVGGDVVVATVTVVERVTGPAVEQTVAYAVETYEDLEAMLNSLSAEDDAAAGEGRATAPTVAAIDSAIVGPAHQMTVLALVAAGGLGAAMVAFAFLRRILSLGGVALLSRINSKDIMKNETRASVFEIVKSDPGVSLNEIVDRLGVSRNAVAYHLAVFESEDQIVSVKDGKYRRYFVNGGKFVNGAKHVVSALKNDTTRQVIDFIKQHPGAIQKDVCAAVGTSPSATNWHINRLEKVGLVNKEKVANTVQYTPGPSFQKYDLDEFGLAYA